MMRKTMYPNVRFESNGDISTRNNMLSKLLPGIQQYSSDLLLIDDIRSGRIISKKRQLFNGKILINKKQKDNLPDELITRKLIWDGK